MDRDGSAACGCPFCACEDSAPVANTALAIRVDPYDNAHYAAWGWLTKHSCTGSTFAFPTGAGGSTRDEYKVFDALRDAVAHCCTAVFPSSHNQAQRDAMLARVVVRTREPPDMIPLHDLQLVCEGSIPPAESDQPRTPFCSRNAPAPHAVTSTTR